MASSWKISAAGAQEIVQGALLAHENAADWDPDIVLSGHETDHGEPRLWAFEAWLPRKPRAADREAIASLFAADAPEFHVEKVDESDWVTLSQQGMEPIRAGRFFVRTPEHSPSPGTDAINLVIPASQAFGTGHHETTAGCLAMLDRIRRSGAVVRNVADIGTGTGLLAFAALALWPRALATASDIDPVCTRIVAENASANQVPMGGGPGQLVMCVADGMAAPLLQARAPYDLLIANILAGPLVDLAADFGAAVIPGGHLVLSGLLETQEASVRRACRKAGFRLAGRLTRGDWSILWLRRRALPGPGSTRQRSLPRWARER